MSETMGALLYVLLILLSTVAYASEKSEAPLISIELGSAEYYSGSVICTKPAFPKDENGEPLEGTVTLSIQINKEGKPNEMVVSKSSGNKRIDETALENAKRSVFPDGAGKTI